MKIMRGHYIFKAVFLLVLAAFPPACRERPVSTTISSTGHPRYAALEVRHPLSALSGPCNIGSQQP